MEKVKIEPFISKLLYDHDCVIIADFGGFVANYKSSFLHPAQHTISPPSKKIAFNSSLKMNDGLLASYIAENNATTYFEACKLISIFVEESINLLENGRKVHLDKIGTLFYNSEKKIQFSPDLTTNYLLDSFGLTPVHSPAIRRDTPVKKMYESSPSINKPAKNKTIFKRRFKWKWIELIPAAAVLTLLFLNPAIIQNLNHNVAGLLPEIRFENPFQNFFGTNLPPAVSPDTKPDLVYESGTIPHENMTGTSPSISPESGNRLTDSLENSTSLPGSVTDNTLNAHSNSQDTAAHENFSTPENPPISTIAENTTGTLQAHSNPVYYVIAGCFKIEDNAVALNADLLSKGYTSEIIGRHKGLHVVTFQRATTLMEAKETVAKLRLSALEAWVLKK